MANLQRIVLYTRTQCPLCDDAKRLLTELQTSLPFAIKEIDISTSDELTETYGLMIPVVVIDGIEVQYGKVDPVVIRNYLSKNDLQS